MLSFVLIYSWQSTIKESVIKWLHINKWSWVYRHVHLQCLCRFLGTVMKCFEVKSSIGAPLSSIAKSWGGGLFLTGGLDSFCWMAWTPCGGCWAWTLWWNWRIESTREFHWKGSVTTIVAVSLDRSDDSISWLIFCNKREAWLIDQFELGP